MCAIGRSGRHRDWKSQNVSFGKPARSMKPVAQEWMPLILNFFTIESAQ